MSNGTNKPSWRNPIPNDWKRDVTEKEYEEEYRNLVLFYSELAVSMASNDMEKLNELVGHLDNLPKPHFDKILEHMSSKAVSSRPEEERLMIWTGLCNFTSRHRRFSDAKWALGSKIISKIEAVAAKLAPTNPLYLHRRLFAGHDFDLYEEKGNLEEQRKKLEERRQQAIKDILAHGGMNMIIQFAQAVESPSKVGFSLGIIAKAKFDKHILPTFLETDNKKLAQFTGDYVCSRQYKNGWAWADGLDRSSWSAPQVGQFLSYLPFSKEAWDRAEAWLGKSEREYWSRTTASLYHTDEAVGSAIDKLIEYERPYSEAVEKKLVHRDSFYVQKEDKSMQDGFEDPPYRGCLKSIPVIPFQ